ncbi:ATP-binding protein [Flavobacterium franklandianum]|uniref:ATP-binding protein n=1 Tax=Flavobacterium franklandianum TaxID=2594430 RepID=A0A553CK83_9FLAO|nr:ATP-binding protein [Flavobacterium franklandianum]TRX20905.1 ATP-binding protein [Flavobacterium franklandianum]TRX23153.1 ATP-binding protein [Flavobacterium franklandianum]
MPFKIPSTIVKREDYIKRVLPYIGKNLIKVFTGQRRVGKSYLLFQIMNYLLEQDSQAAIVYVNKEDIAFSALKTAQDLHDYVLQQKSNSAMTYVFIDEIQDIENFETALRSLLLHDDLDLYCTGSNANLLSGDIAGYLSGRAIEIVVYSLSYPEFLVFHSLKESVQTLEMYFKYGGLPYLKNLVLEEAVVFEYLKNIYNTIVYRDIINRFPIRNVLFLEQLVLFLASNIGSLFSAKKISDFLKSQHINMASNQVQTYSDYLVNAFLIHRVSRYDLIGKRIFETGEKYYFENLGIRNSLWGYRLEDRAKIMENVVYNHLLFRGYQVQVGNLGALEIDFVAQRAGEKLYVQVALSINEPQTMEREFGNLKKINDNFPKVVITLDKFDGNTNEGILATDLRSFLLTY